MEPCFHQGGLWITVIVQLEISLGLRLRGLIQAQTEGLRLLPEFLMGTI